MRTCERCIFDAVATTEITFKKKDFIFFEGDEVETVYYVKEGLIKLEKVGEDGEVRIIDIITTGDHIALLTVINEEETYKVTASALTDVVVKPILKVRADKAYQQNLHFKETCLKCASNRLSVFQRHTFNSGNTEPTTKIISTLKHLSIKFGYKENGNTVINVPITKAELANMCGLRRETLSRKLKSLQEEGLLEYNKNRYKLIGM